MTQTETENEVLVRIYGNSTLKERFENRYSKSAIYDPMFVDWFPDDVMSFIRLENKVKLHTLREKIEQLPRPDNEQGRIYQDQVLSLLDTELGDSE
jgi:hypothetical protein